MPRISVFYGIVIAMYHREHAPPHFHAIYGGSRASFVIEPVTRLSGKLPPRAERMVRQWAALHGAELLSNWRRAQRNEELLRIDPLD